MGFHARNSILAWPFRFLLNGSRITVRPDIPGTRPGKTPRTNYIRIDSRGIDYRVATTGATSHSTTRTTSASEAVAPFNEDGATGASGNEIDLEPTVSSDLTQQLNAAKGRIPWGVIAAVLLIAVGFIDAPRTFAFWIIGIPLALWLIIQDAAERRVVVFYDVSDAHKDWFQALVHAWVPVTHSEKIWLTVASARITSTKVRKENAGVDRLVKREEGRADLDGPKHLKTNVDVPTVRVGAASLFFLPDRVLIWENGEYSDIDYRRLGLSYSKKKFVHRSGEMPRDAQQVGRKWKYVNKNGTPDKRYNDNRMFPVLLYGHLDLATSGGLVWHLQTSRADAAPSVGRILERFPGR